MKSVFIYTLTLLLTLSFIGCQPARHNGEAGLAFNPGQFWYDNQQQLINAHGGGILFYDNTYYWFGEYKSDTTSAAMDGVSCYTSQDLYHWNYQGIALCVSKDTNSDIATGCILERPKVIYNKATHLFVMYFHLELRGQGYSSARIGVAISQQPTGPYTFLRSYRPNPNILPLNLTTTTSFQSVDSYQWWTPEWEKAVRDGLYLMRDLPSGQMSRDMTLFVDDNDKAYHIYASEENLTLHIAELSDDYLSHNGNYIRIEAGGHNEAPAIFKKEGKYFMITSGCTGWEPNAARLLTADSIMGSWHYINNPCIGDDADLTFHSQSTYILPVQGKHDAFIFMADRWKPECHTQSTYIWLPIHFRQGLPYLEWKDQWDLNFFN